MFIIPVPIPFLLVIKYHIAQSTHIHPIVVVLIFNMGFMINVVLKFLRTLSALLSVMWPHSPDMIAETGLKVVCHTALDTEVANLRNKKSNGFM